MVAVMPVIKLSTLSLPVVPPKFVHNGKLIELKLVLKKQDVLILVHNGSDKFSNLAVLNDCISKVVHSGMLNIQPAGVVNPLLSNDKFPTDVTFGVSTSVSFGQF